MTRGNDARDQIPEIQQEVGPQWRVIIRNCQIPWHHHFVRSFNAILDTVYFSLQAVSTHICMILKLLRRYQVGQMQPMSLLNVDIKFITKVLALRVNTCIGKLIYQKQVEFISRIQAGDNIRRIVNLFHLATQ